MAELSPLLAVDEALARIAAALPPAETEKTSLDQALGRVLASPVNALLDHPLALFQPWMAMPQDLKTF